MLLPLGTPEVVSQSEMPASKENSGSFTYFRLRNTYIKHQVDEQKCIIHTKYPGNPGVGSTLIVSVTTLLDTIISVEVTVWPAGFNEVTK